MSIEELSSSSNVKWQHTVLWLPGHRGVAGLKDKFSLAKM